VQFSSTSSASAMSQNSIISTTKADTVSPALVHSSPLTFLVASAIGLSSVTGTLLYAQVLTLIQRLLTVTLIARMHSFQ
jgi:hypothetical protein